MYIQALFNGILSLDKSGKLFRKIGKSMKMYMKMYQPRCTFVYVIYKVHDIWLGLLFVMYCSYSMTF